MARKDIAMSPDEVMFFLEEPRNITVTTLGPRGWPHAAPMWYVLRDGKVAFRSFTKSQKIVNLRREPRLTVLAEEGVAYNDLKGVMIEGEAELVDDARDLGVRVGVVGEAHEVAAELAGQTERGLGVGDRVRPPSAVTTMTSGIFFLPTSSSSTSPPPR